MSHFSSSLYRWQFQQCRNGGESGDCPICPPPTPPQTPVELFYEKFDGAMPSPVPFWGTFPPKPASPNDPKEPVACVTSLLSDRRSAAAGLHYRSLMDIIKLNIPASRLYPDQHYDGPTARHVCTVCKPDVCHRSAAALVRHMKMLHQ